MFNFDWSKRFKAFLDMLIVFQIFDCFATLVKKFNPDDAQNVRNCFN